MRSHDERLDRIAEDVARLGYAQVSLGTLAESGPMTKARGDSWSPLGFQDSKTSSSSIESTA
jgi:hypothetical protein